MDGEVDGALYIIWRDSDGNRHVPYLNRWNDDRRNLNLNYLENDWNGNYRFLAVRNFYHFSLDNFISGEFCLLFVFSNHQAFCRFLKNFEKYEYIVYLEVLWFPKQEVEVVLIDLL